MPSSWKPHGKFACSTRSATPNPDRDAGLRLIAAARGGRRGRWLRALLGAGSVESLMAMDTALQRRAGLHAADVAALNRREPPPPGWQAWLDRPGHDLVVIGSKRYPQALAEIADPPIALWVDGCDVSLLSQPQIAIVGSRHPTHNGKAIAESLARGLSQSGLTVTSGLARGIDGAGHIGALAGDGSTVAVLGSGIDRIYPAGNRKLAECVRDRGLIVSEYAPGEPVRRRQFPERNRIIAGLSLGTVVVEATRRSGSLITARLASENGREVFAVPGSILSPLSKGCHKLITGGAKLVEDTDDILVELMPQLRAAIDETRLNADSSGSDELPAPLEKCLDYSPITMDSLLLATGLTAAELSSMLLHLEIQGKIEALPGGRYCRLAKRA